MIFLNFLKMNSNNNNNNNSNNSNNNKFIDMNHIYCIRHGETDWNKIGRFQGNANIKLNENGRRQAFDIISIIDKLKIDIIYVSSLDRALETAHIIARALNLNVVERDDLKEIDVGLASGVLIDQMDDNFGEGTIEKWKSCEEQYDNFSFPGGETKANFRKRVLRAVLNIVEQTDKNKNLAIVTHGFFLKQLLIAIGNRNIEGSPFGNCSGIKNTEIVHVLYNRKDKKLKFIERF